MAAEGESRPDDEREGADLGGHLCARSSIVVRDAGPGDVEADLEHGVLEKLAVLALGDGLGVRADQADAVLLSGCLCAMEVHGGVERGLAAQRRAARRPDAFRRR